MLRTKSDFLWMWVLGYILVGYYVISPSVDWSVWEIEIIPALLWNVPIFYNVIALRVFVVGVFVRAVIE